MKRGDPAEFARALGLAPTPAQTSRLLAYEAMLEDRGVLLGLVGKADAHRVRERHLLDCMRAVPHVVQSGLVYDLGSGAGLPGIVVAILRPEAGVLLVERRSRRAGFLEWAIRSLDLANAEVAPCGIEDLAQGEAGTCTARALASLEESWVLAVPLLKPRGCLVYFAGESASVPAELPGAGSVRAVGCEMLESAGPLAIITR